MPFISVKEKYSSLIIINWAIITNIYTLYNGVELDKFKDSKKNRKDIRKKYNIKDSDFVYLYTGRIVEIKGVREWL